MTSKAPRPQVERLAIAHLTIKADSALDARRLADALPDLLRQRLEKGPGTARARHGRASPWSEAADQIARAIEARLETRDG
ncbi:hypothetical protein [Novosphingobium sp. MBES04]|uniref:hypothetical protein n=1 Tax=Novosphingobium sp. MBES04 TaxID=1206458 RepID=UPI00057CFEC6|nr:hypothetical protein [Novosphingobium sp. MBES04]GAM03475.1 hypothetical protein MBENS4_0474 [Novosphingobium sp. MBES04]